MQLTPEQVKGRIKNVAKENKADAYPSLKKMYAADDGNTEVFYFKNGVAAITTIFSRKVDSQRDFFRHKSEVKFG